MDTSGGSAGNGPAARFLHVCYCCRRADLDPVVALFTGQFGFRNTMSTPEGKSSGYVLGMDRDFVSTTAFLYDARGPRTSPAIELQAWVDPPVEGTPPVSPTVTGIAALGISVPSLDPAVRSLEAAGCTVVGRGRSPFGELWANVRDITGVTLDLVESASRPEPQLAHIRIGCTDLGRSLPWYRQLGFEEVGRTRFGEGTFLGVEGRVEAEAVRLRLAEEPFEAVLVEWAEPAPAGTRHPDRANSAGLFRAALRVDDTREAHRSLAAAGWSFDRPPMSVELTGTPVPDMWICFMSDPDGVPFELVERPASAFRP